MPNIESRVEFLDLIVRNYSKIYALRSNYFESNIFFILSQYITFFMKWKKRAFLESHNLYLVESVPKYLIHGKNLNCAYF